MLELVRGWQIPSTPTVNMNTRLFWVNIGLFKENVGIFFVHVGLFPNFGTRFGMAGPLDQEDLLEVDGVCKYRTFQSDSIALLGELFAGM